MTRHPLARMTLGLMALALVPLLGLSSVGTPAPAEAAPAALPAAPPGWPSTLQLGHADSPGGAAAMKAVAPYGFRYQYLSGGVRTGGNWATWNPDGQFVTYYVQESAQQGITPVFTYYMIYQSAPGNSQSESNGVWTNLQDSTTMRAYYDNLKLFFQRAGASSGTAVVLHVEPDMWGYLQQRSTGDNAATVPVKVAATGMPELAGLPDNLVGFARALEVLRDTYGRNVLLGYHLSVWGTGNDIAYTNPPDATVDALATRAGSFFTSLNGSFDLAFGEFSDRDSGFKQYQYNDGGASWWDASDFARHVRFVTRFVDVTQMRMVMWQIPQGNTKMRAMNNTWNHYQDNRVEWLLDDPGRAHLAEYVNAGVVAFLFGRGADGATCACDANGDGVTNPAAINGNTRTSLNADDDGGYFRERAQAYYAAGPMPLSGGTTSPTATPTAPITATPTATTPPTSTPSSGTQTITFDDKAGQNQPLDGQYPTGLIDWGSGQWLHSGPFGAFTTKSISFNAAGVTSRGFTFLSPRRVVSVQAYNGGGASSTVTLGCAGQPNKVATVTPAQVATITTGWTAACTTVTIASTNGWDTNFDNLVIGSASSSTATATATATRPPATVTPTPTQSAATATATATRTPAAGSQTVTFDDRSGQNQALNGQYPAGVIDWGTGQWWHAGPFGAFTGKSASFTQGGTSRSFTFVTPRRLVSIQAYNGGTGSATISLACSGKTTKTMTVAAGQVATVNTGWTGTCSTVTVTSSNGWDTNLDNLVHDAG